VELPREGVELLINDMVLIAPKRRARPHSAEMSVDLLRETLAKPKVPSLARKVATGDVNLSDFE
jgi:hypothetical protein